MVRTDEGLTEEFWTNRRKSHSCVLSPILLNLYIADLDKYFLNKGIVLRPGERAKHSCLPNTSLVRTRSRSGASDLKRKLYSRPRRTPRGPVLGQGT